MIPNKISYVSGPAEKPLTGMTIGEKFDEIVRTYPDREALIVPFQDIRWTYREFKAQVDRFARALLALGLRKGERIGIWSFNCAEWAITQFASAKIGAILVNLNPSYRLHELEYALRQSGCNMLVTAHAFKYSKYTEMLYTLLPELHRCEPGKLVAQHAPKLRTIIRIHKEPSRGMLSWDEAESFAKRVSQEEMEAQATRLSFDDPINIQYTSGTTGHPKGATLSHHNILNNAIFVADFMQLTERDRLIVPVPLYHCFGMVLGNLGCMTHGSAVIYPSEGFDALAVLQCVEKEKATALYGVPTMFLAEVEHPDFDRYDKSSLRTGIMAGAPCPIELMKRVKRDMHMDEVQIAYGMTETSPVSTQTRMGTSLENQVSTVGQVHPHQELRIVDPESGLTVPIGEKGEICMRGYQVMLGYWKNEELTKEAIDPARWIHSGDLGTMDEEGYIRISGRIKDMIIRGGENIYPREIEEFLYSHPAISEVQVIGVPDEKYGEEVMAWIQLKDGSKETPDAIRAFCKGNIAYYKIPRYIKFVEHFPMTVTGKIRKVEMREISIRELALESVS